MLIEVIKEQITFLRSAWLARVLLSLHNTCPHSAFRGIDCEMDGGDLDNRRDGENDAEKEKIRFPHLGDGVRK